MYRSYGIVIALKSGAENVPQRREMKCVWIYSHISFYCSLYLYKNKQKTIYKNLTLKQR
jgi:hypothetical protein